MVGVQLAAYSGIIDVVRVPQPQLPHRGIETQLEHVAGTIRQVGLCAVPDTVVRHHHRTRLAHHGHLPEEILVTGDIGLADATVVAAGQHHRPAHLAGRVVGEVEELDVEGSAGVDDGVGMPALSLLPVGWNDVYGVVVVERVLTHQAGHDALDLRQPHHVTDRGSLPHACEGIATPGTLDAGFHLGQGAFVEFRRHHVIKPQEPVGNELCHFFRRQQIFLVRHCHSPTSSSCSRMYSYLR